MVESIVLAEDNLEHCFFFKMALKAVAPEVKFADVHDGDQLLQLLESYSPDLLFLDLSMPCRDGVECIKEIRNHREYDALPIVVFSVADDSRHIQAAYGFGANLYVVKPAEYQQLKTMLHRVLSMNWDDPQAITAQYFKGDHYVTFPVGA